MTLVNDWDNDEDVHLKRGESRTYTIPAFAIAKYPITNAQFRQFVDADGYKQQKWWTDAGWEAKKRGLLVEWDSKTTYWKTKETGMPWTQPRLWSDEIEYGDDYPVVGVSWYEAIAFCHWLRATSGEKVMLPTETQWQRAAQALPNGNNSGYIYPWGNEWDGNKCNNSVAPFQSDKATPVLRYSKQGDSPCGVVDMVGNVWEWCLTEYYSGANDLKGANVRVLRGGSWDDDITINFYTTVRDADYPSGWDGNVGFRIALL